MINHPNYSCYEDFLGATLRLSLHSRHFRCFLHFDFISRLCHALSHPWWRDDLVLGHPSRLLLRCKLQFIAQSLGGWSLFEEEIPDEEGE